MKIFVTGATGFIGRHLTTRLAEEGHTVICGVRSPAKLKSICDKTESDKVKSGRENFGKIKSARVYLEHKETISRVIKEEKPDVVYHSAALVESTSPEKLRRVNVEGTRNVFEACFSEGVKKVIYLSSIAAISGNEEMPLTDDLPLKAKSPYGESKLEAEKIALLYRKKGLKIAILRPCMVYGEGEPHALRFLVSALKKRLLPVLGTGDNKLHLVSVENVVDVMLLSLSTEEAFSGTFIVADKEVLSVKEILFYIAEILDIKPPIVLPQGITNVLAKIPIIGKRMSYFQKDRIYSIKRLLEVLGYMPRVSIYDGLKHAVLPYKKT